MAICSYPITQENILEAIVLVFKKRYPMYDTKFLASFMSREINTMICKGYNDDRYTNAFFCVKGSPNKFYGFMEIFEGHPNSCLKITSNWGKFYIDNSNLVKTTKPVYCY